MSVKARIRVAAGDPGIRNYGFCIIELTRVDSIVGIEGPRTRTPVPRFRILHWEVMDLTAEPEMEYDANSDSDDADAADAETGVLASLHAALTSQKAESNDMPRWRNNLARRIASTCPVLFERYNCDMTGRRELPVLALENQLDVAVDKRSGAERAEWKKLADAMDRAKALSPEERQQIQAPWLASVVDLLARKRVQLKRSDDFIKGRMYTLSQILAGSVETVDALSVQKSDRLVINSAKKHAIASDGAREYEQRKEEAIRVTREMLQEQRDSDDSSEEDRTHARKWLAFLGSQSNAGQKLDDLCDAFLMAIAVALKVHKKYAKNVHKGAVMPCYAPVTNADLAAAATKKAAPGVPIADAAKPATKKRKRAAQEEPKKAPKEKRARR